MRSYKVKNCNRVHGLSFTPDGRELLVLGGYYAKGIQTKAWLDLDRGQPAPTLMFFIDGYALAADHSRMVIGADAWSRPALTNLVRWRDPRKKKGKWSPVKIGVSWSADTSVVTADVLALTPDASRVVIGYSRQVFRECFAWWTYHLTVCSFDRAASPAVIDLQRPISLLAAAPDGTRWASLTGDNRELHLANQPGGDPLATRRFPTGQTGTFAFSPDGRLLAVPNFRTVYLFRAHRLEAAGTLEGHAKRVNALAFTPDGRHLVTTSHDETVRVWDVKTGKELNVFDWKIGLVSAVAIAPDGLTCAAAGDRGQVVVWDADP